MAAQNINTQEFLGHLLNAAITSSLELEKDTSVRRRHYFEFTYHKTIIKLS